MTNAPPNPIPEILALTRDAKHDEAKSLVTARLASCAEADRPLLEDCKALLDWRVSNVSPRPLSEGLTEAIVAVTRLREAGYEAETGWAFVYLGYAVGMQGDFERGLEWLEVAVADARQRNDRRQLIFSYSHQGSLLAHAEEPEHAYALYRQVLDLCDGDQAAQRPAFLSNLAHCRLLQARQLRADDPQVPALAREALQYANETIEEVGPTHPLAVWLCSFNINRGDALRLLGNVTEAEAAYHTSLAGAGHNPRVKSEVLASYAALLLDLGRQAEAETMLTEADAITPFGLLNPAIDRILELQIALARRAGRIDDVHALWERRFQRVQDRHRDRLRNVRRYAELFQQLKEVRAAEQQVRQEAEGERSRHEEQERFLSMLTHELKTPVGVARISLGAMKTSGRNTERIERALSNINAIIERCRVTGELEHDKLRPTFEPCDLVDLVRQTVDGCAQPERAQVSESNLPAVATDSLLLGIVVANLIDNALKYSPPESLVAVSCKMHTVQDRERVELVVANLPGAAGVPDPQRAFEKYFRGRAAQAKSGSGLGLYLASGISGLLGGGLECRPTSERIEFALWLPI